MNTLAKLMLGARPLYEEADGAKGAEAKVEAKSEAKAEETPKAEVKAEAPPKVEEAPKPPLADTAKPDWRDRRISQLTAQLRQGKVTEDTGKPPLLDPTKDFNDRVAAAANAQAREIAAQKEFNDRCNSAAAEGREKFGKDEFNTRLGQVLRVAGIDPAHPELVDPAALGQYNEFLLATLETGEAPKLLFELGGDPNETARILALTPRKMAVELTKLAVKAPAEEVSSLPKPITPVDARGARHEEISPTDTERADTLDTKTWMERRQKAVDAAMAARR